MANRKDLIAMMGYHLNRRNAMWKMERAGRGKFLEQNKPLYPNHTAVMTK